MKHATLIPNIQLFAVGDAAGGGSSESGQGGVPAANAVGGTEAKSDNADAGGSGEASTAEAKASTERQEQQGNESMERLVQSRVDRLTAELGKKNAELQRAVDKLAREKLSAEEIKALEIADKEKALADKEKSLADKENRLYAIRAIKEIGLDDGSELSLSLVDLVNAETPELIDGRVKSLSELVKQMVATEVDKTFKANGRIPNGSTAGTGQPAGSIAERLGNTRAEQLKKSNEVLAHYLGGSKQ